MYSAHFISETISKDICAQLAREVVNLVPQVIDYTCSVCKYPSLLFEAPLYHPRGASPHYLPAVLVCTDLLPRPFPWLAAYQAGLQPYLLHPLHDQAAKPEQAALPALPSRCSPGCQRE